MTGASSLPLHPVDPSSDPSPKAASSHLARFEQIRGLRTARDLIDARRSRPEDEYFPTACAPLDRLLRGGLQRGSLVELCGWGSSGRFSLVWHILAAVTARGEAAALVDLGDGLDPQGAREAGISLERLLWARPRTTKEALSSSEVILDAGLPLIVIEMGVPPVPGGRGSQAFWLRLARAAEHHRSALLVSSPYRVTGTAARTVLETRDRRGRWQGRGRTPKLLEGVRTELALVKGAGWQRSVPEELLLGIDPAPLDIKRENKLSKKEKIEEKKKLLSETSPPSRRGRAGNKKEGLPADPLMTARKAIA